MIKNFKKFQLIAESPDKINYDGGVIHAESDDAIAFTFSLNDDKSIKNVYTLNPSKYHNNNKIDDTNLAYPGRLWLKHRLISFWTYPEPTHFYKFIKYLEDNLDIVILNNNWDIEVLISNDDDEIVNVPIDADDTYFMNVDDDNVSTKIISVDDYTGSKKFSEEEKKWHLMNAIEKENARKKQKQNVPSGLGWGSSKTSWDSKNPLPLRYAKHQEHKHF